jgi:photosystem II stability/assembly factor-like uncharacterized protein
MRLTRASGLALLLVAACTAETELDGPPEDPSGWSRELCTAGLPPPETALAASWAPQKTGTLLGLYAVDFVTPRCGWAVGTFGVMVRTVDGGETWTAPARPYTADFLRAVAFADLDRGWIVGNNGLVLRTDDGGDSWRFQHYETTFEIYDLAVVDGETLYLAAGGPDGDGGPTGWVAKSTDGGETWTRVLERGAYLRKVAFADADHGWAASWDHEAGTTLFRTTDGGATWTVQDPLTTMELPADLVALGADTAWLALRFYDGQRGQQLLATRDGGATWARMPPVEDFALDGISFADPSHGWAVGAGGAILATEDGGASWKVQKPGAWVDGDPQNEQYVAVDFVDPEHGWTVGFGGAVLATTTGGW